MLASDVKVGNRIQLKHGQFVEVTGITKGRLLAPLRSNKALKFTWTEGGVPQAGTVYAGSTLLVQA